MERGVGYMLSPKWVFHFIIAREDGRIQRFNPSAFSDYKPVAERLEIVQSSNGRTA